MSVTYEAVFSCDESGGVLSLTRRVADGDPDTTPVDLAAVEAITEACREGKWSQSADQCREIGEQLFDLLNGDRQTLARALREAHEAGTVLEFYVTPAGPAIDLPFELLYHEGHLSPKRVHLVRRITDRGLRSEVAPKDRPLKVLFMACSADDVPPILDFEREEDSIYAVTENLPVEIEVEDTGSLEGLGDRLTKEEYDVVHLSGHADIGKDGEPHFWMEDEEGMGVRVSPEALWEKLRLNPPRLLFLSGCRTGEKPRAEAVVSFAQRLVGEGCSCVLGWGLPVTDRGATAAAKVIYFELSRGRDLLRAVREARSELFERHGGDWPLLRVFSDGCPLGVPLVEKEQKKRVRRRDLQHTYLHNSQVKVLREGFVGRRKQIQRGLRVLRKGREKVGLLLHGTGGLGKSCLAGRLCERMSDHELVIVHGELNAVTMSKALKAAFLRAKDTEGLAVLEASVELAEKLQVLSTSSLQDRNYLILLDDFEQNMPKAKEGRTELSPQAVPLVEALLRFLPDSAKMTQLVITSRYSFPLTVEGENLVDRVLESIDLTSFRGADERKKVAELSGIAGYEDEAVRGRLIAAGRGNPRLMEAIDTLVREKSDLDVDALLSEIEGKQDEFVQGLVLREILGSQSEGFGEFVRRSAVYRLPVLERGLEQVCAGVEGWKQSRDRAIVLSLMEKDRAAGGLDYYWVTPMLQGEVFEELGEGERKACHEAAVAYYRGILDEASGYLPVEGVEVVVHALSGGMEEVAVEEGGRLLPYLREALAYREALMWGETIKESVTEPQRNGEYSKFIFELGWILDDLGDARRAIEDYEQALSIAKEVFGEKHSSVATILSNLGTAWNALGKGRRAIEYHEKSLKIRIKVHGERHPAVATTLSNLGIAWRALGKEKRAIEYYEQALSIDREVYGDRHPNVAVRLNNIGGAWHGLGEAKRAIEYFEQALSISKEVHGERHPTVATTLNNLGEAWRALGEAEQAIEYYEQALSIGREVFGDRHPKVAIRLNNIGLAWHDLGDAKRAVEYYEQALSIDREVFGDRHPHTAIGYGNLGSALRDLGDVRRAREHILKAYNIFREVLGDDHPHTRSTKQALDELKE